MKLTVLCDNNTFIDQYLFGEPAVSYFLEDDGLRLLFDAGYSNVFLQNAELLGIDLLQLTHLVFSHGHNDHTRGLKFLLQKSDLKNTELICHSECLAPKFLNSEDIGSSFLPDVIEKSCRYHPSDKPLWINERCVFLGQIPLTMSFEPPLAIGKTLTESGWQPDTLKDDSALAIKTDAGIFIVTGCSHSGICNICEYAKQVCDDERICGIIGGLHLMRDGERLNKTIEYLKGENVPRLYPCHCVPLFAKLKMGRTLDIKEVGSGMSIAI